MDAYQAAMTPTVRFQPLSTARVAFALLLLSLGARISAQTVISWADTGTDFATGSDWIGGVAPANSLTANIANFGTASPTAQPNLAASQSVAGVEFGSEAGAFTFSGTGTLTLGASGIDNESSGAQTISAPLALGAAATLSSSVGGTLNISGPIDTGGFALGLGSGTGTLSGAISGTGSVTLLGANGSSWTLSATNNYSGGTTVENGTIILRVSGALLSTGNVIINDTESGGTATLQLANGVNQAIGSLYFGGSGSGASATNAVQIGSGSTLTLGGIVTYDATDNPQGATISGGTLALGGNQTFDVAHSTSTTNDLTISSVITGEGDTLTKTGSGNLALSGADTYSGGTVVEDGTVTVYASGSLLSTGDLTINATAAGGTAMFVLGTSTSQTIGNLTLGGAGGGSDASNIVALGSGSVLTVSGAVTYNAATNPAAGQITGGALALPGTATFNVGHSTNSGNYDLIVSSTITGSGALAKTGNGIMQLTGSNSYSGGTTVSGGQLVLANTAASGTGSMDIQSGGTLRGTGTISGLATIESGGMVSPGITGSPGTLTFSGGLTLNSGSTYDFQLGTSSDKIVVTAGALTGPGAVGTLTINLSNAGGFTAGTYDLIDFSTDATPPTGFNAADFTLGTTISGYDYSLTVSGDMLDLTATSAIPEPATDATIFGAAALGGAVWRKRRSRSVPA